MIGFSATILENNKHKKQEIAIIDQDGKRKTTWEELRTLVFQIASYASCKELSGIIPVCMDRGVEAIVSVLGLNLAGCSISPLSITTPKERLTNISEQTQKNVWTIDSYNEAIIDDCSKHPFMTAKSFEKGELAPKDNSVWGKREKEEAYVVFTSGSTGTPKGVLLSNRAVNACTKRTSGKDFFNYQEDAIALQTCSFSFSGCIVDMFSPLYFGCPLHIFPENKRGDINALTEYLNTYRITNVVIPPQLYRTFGGADTLRCVITGGDRIINLGPIGHCRFIGAYGLSETAAICFSYEYREPIKTTPIGKPAEEICLYILDDDGNLSDEGEICLSGPVAHGYLHMPEQTAKTFTANPFSNEPGQEILLHTGDMGKRLEDGTVLYVSRKDNMLKINGQRVESGEIELAITEFPGIHVAVVKGFSDEEGRSFLCAYYTSDAPIDTDALKSHLESKLTHYMIPSAFVRMDKFPVNNNGKIDRKLLKMPDFAVFKNVYEAPQNELESAICHGFEVALNLDQVGALDDFFRIGGDSINALSVIKECENYHIAVTDILSGKTPRGIAKLVGERRTDVYLGLSKAGNRAPLTDSQMGVYLSCVREPESKMYNMPFHMTFDLPTQYTAKETETIVNNILKLHPTLYAHIEEQDGQPYMVRTDYPKEGLCRCFEEDVAEDVLQQREKNFIRSFDLKQGPLCRMQAYFTKGKLHLLTDIHHVAADGSSIQILCRQLSDTFGGETVMPERIDAFSLYEAEERKLSSPEHQTDIDYFDALLGDADIDSNLLPDFKSPASGLGNAVRLDTLFDVQPIAEMLSQTDITENTLFMGAFGYALAKMTGQENSLFTVGESGRAGSHLENTVCMTVRTLPVVLHLDEKQSGRQMLSDLQDQFYHSMQHDSVSFGELNRKYRLNTDVSFVYQSELLSGYNGTIKAKITTLPNEDTFSHLTVSVLKQGEQYVLRTEYRKDLYKAETIRRFSSLFLLAVNHITSDQPLYTMKLISNAETRQLDSFNNTYLLYNAQQTFVDIFQNTVKKYRDKTAVVFRDTRYTYGEVDELSDRIAAYIHQQHIGKEETVAILIPRCEYMAIASIGVLKAGAIYEPMDPSYPTERLTLMHTDADAKLLICDRSMRDLLPEYTGPVLFTDEIPNLPKVSHTEVLAWAPTPDDTYILLYTSGTTGKPKGCMLTHGNLVAFIVAHTKTLMIDDTCKLTLYPSYGFDAHMADLYPAMANGCELYIIPDEMRLDFPVLKSYLEQNQMTHLLMTTQVARQFILEYPLVDHLRVIDMGGESLLSFEPKTNYTILNLYGPSETTVCVTEFNVDKLYDPIPIGHANSNSHLFVTDSYGRRVPIGVPGELVISGPQVAKGYLHRPEKTAEVFVPNTFEASPDESHLRCYRTGDVVRYLDDGNIEFIGRRDSQVKIRGFRIELSEVELVIRAYPGIKDAAVIASDFKGEKCLHAYVVSDEKVDMVALCDFIRSQKPAYMVPAGLMQIDKIPLTVNQKLDKRKLPPIIKEEKAESQINRSLTALEESLMAVLKEIVGDGNFDVQTTFEDAGITSISSIKLANTIYKKYGVHITSKDLLDGGTILSVENIIIDQLLVNHGRIETNEPKQLQTSYPLTETQMGIYLDSQRVGIGAYNIPMLVRLPDDIEIAKLKDAIKQAVYCHPSMLSFVHTDIIGNVAMYPAPDLPLQVDEVEMKELQPHFTDFEFSTKPLFHFTIITCQGVKYLFMEIHHIIGDGESVGILMDDIDKAYKGEHTESEAITAFDLSLEEQEARNSDKLPKAKAVYDTVFKGISSDYTPSYDNQGKDSYATIQYAVATPISAVADFCKAHRITENTLFTAVFAFVISKYTGHEDALFSTIYNGRVDPRVERLVSMLVKTLPIFVQANGTTDTSAFLNHVEEQLQTLKLHDIFSYADAVREYGMSIDTMFIYQGDIVSNMQLNGHALETIPVTFDSPKASLSTELFKGENGFGITIEYNAGHYSHAFIEGFAEAYATCLDDFLKAETLADIHITSANALRLLNTFNETDIDIPYYPAYQRFVLEAQAHPDRVAVIASPENEKQFKTPDGKRIYEQLTYRQLDNMTNYLARCLITLGITPETPIGVMTGRSKEVYVGEFGILKAGCPFIFLSPSYPADRINYICNEASVKAIVTTHAVYEAYKDTFGTLNIHVLFADDVPHDVISDCPNIERQPDSLAYMIYTSGSTGKPKGVMITQKGLNNLTDNNDKNMQIKGILADVMLAVAAFTFDASIIDGYAVLSNGATLCIASDEDIHNPVEFCQICLDHGVKSFVCTPSFATSLTDYPGFEQVAKQLTSVCCGGEVYPPSLYTKLTAMNPAIKLINGYGPSETTVCCTAKLLSSSQNIDIGTPINNYKIYIIDAQNHILPMGALGELVVTGIGVGRGYLNRPDLTQKSFFRLNEQPAYKTGDLALITHDGHIAFHGRMDNQVKLRGLRVELGEIENAINTCDGVKTSVVLVHGQEQQAYLVAYYTADSDITPNEIKTRIEKSLTEYMVPRIIIRLDEMPMTANGKIDKKSLPKTECIENKQDYVAPSNPLEEELCRAFADTLGLKRVGVTDDFFNLGGTSLTATKIAMYAMAHQIPVVYKDIFAHPTVKELAQLAQQNELGTAKIEKTTSEKDTAVRTALSQNTLDAANDIGDRPLGNILLTGATGFLGMYVLKDYLEHETGDVYCLLRKGSLHSVEARLNALFYYYFEKSVIELANGRIHCIDGDITDKVCVLSLQNIPVDTIINCAACVKHFAAGNILEKVNVEGVQNLVDLCMINKARFIHVSTVSVAGEGVGDVPGKDTKLFENNLYFHQTLENQYILTKFKAEKLVLDAIATGLDAKIMRVSNLMPRTYDGEFQINYLTNGFMRRLGGYNALGCIPYSNLSFEMEFSPIDNTAEAILKLAKTDSRFTVFHPFNIHKVFMSDVIKAMNEAGLNIKCVPDIEFASRLKDAMENPNSGDDIGGLIAYSNGIGGENRYMIGCDNAFTSGILNRLGYHWHITDDTYLVNVFQKLITLGFFTPKQGNRHE